MPKNPEAPDSVVVIDHEIDAMLWRIIAPPPSPLGDQIATVTTVDNRRPRTERLRARTNFARESHFYPPYSETESNVV